MTKTTTCSGIVSDKVCEFPFFSPPDERQIIQTVLDFKQLAVFPTHMFYLGGLPKYIKDCLVTLFSFFLHFILLFFHSSERTTLPLIDGRYLSCLLSVSCCFDIRITGKKSRCEVCFMGGLLKRNIAG